MTKQIEMMASSAPIRNLDAFDVVGVRKDGGVDLVISCHGPLDDSPSTLSALERKIRNYVQEVRTATMPTFFERYGCSPDAKIAICVSCKYPIHARVWQLLDELQSVVASIGARIDVRTEMG